MKHAYLFTTIASWIALIASIQFFESDPYFTLFVLSIATILTIAPFMYFDEFESTYTSTLSTHTFSKFQISIDDEAYKLYATKCRHQGVFPKSKLSIECSLNVPYRI